MPNAPTLTLVRTGQFTVRTIPGSPHCGTAEYLRVNYLVRVTCSITSLDERGFLFDQVNIAKYFANIKTVSVSCERLCAQSARGLYALIMSENSSCSVLAVHVRLSPEPFAASMAFDWSTNA